MPQSNMNLVMVLIWVIGFAAFTYFFAQMVMGEGIGALGVIIVLLIIIASAFFLYQGGRRTA